MKTKSNNIIMQNKGIAGVFGVTAFILLIHLLANWPWTMSDFVVMGILISGTGLMCVLVARKVKNIKYRAAIAIAILVAFLLTWVHLAVGIIDNAPFAGS